MNQEKLDSKIEIVNKLILCLSLLDTQLTVQFIGFLFWDGWLISKILEVVKT